MDPKSQFAALLEQGYLARREGRPADAKAAYMAALQIAESGGDSALALTRQGGIERDMGNDETALGLYRQAVEIYRGLDEPLKLATPFAMWATSLTKSLSLSLRRRVFPKRFRSTAATPRRAPSIWPTPCAAMRCSRRDWAG